MLRASSVLALAVTTLVFGACGGDENADTTAQLALPRQPDAGCTQQHPLRWVNNALEGFFRACGTAAADSIVVINTSSASLRVRAADLLDAPTMRAGSGEASSFEAVAVRDAVSGQCVLASRGPCVVPPGGQLHADGTAPVGILVDVDPEMTAVATAARAAAGYVQARLTPRPLRFKASVVSCGRSVAALMTPDRYIEDAVRQAFEFESCVSLVRQIDAELRQPPSVPETEVRRALNAAGSFTKNLRHDFYVYRAIRIASFFR